MKLDRELLELSLLLCCVLLKSDIFQGDINVTEGLQALPELNCQRIRWMWAPVRTCMNLAGLKMLMDLARRGRFLQAIGE